MQQRFLGDLIAFQRRDQMPGTHDQRPVAQADDLRELRADHEDGAALAGEFAQQAINLDLAADVDALRRLVEDQDARVNRQPARQDDLLLRAAGEIARFRFRAGHFDAQPLDVLVDQLVLRLLADQRARPPQAASA